ncbi:MAG: hypothetical protein AAB214_09280 [Fibrobacterota bacterium]
MFIDHTPGKHARTAFLSLLVAFAPLWALNEGMATHFLGVGFPYGACGVSDEIAATEGAMDTLSGQGNPFDYVALNVYDTPGNYDSPGTLGKRPLTGSDTLKMGTYRNGLNCGRWIKLSLGDTCDGQNDGAMNQPFCRGGTGWHPNAYTGSGVYAIVFDQCTDGNAWCRDSKYHLDLHTSILGHLRKDGQILPPLASLVLDANGKPKADPNNPWAREYVVTGFGNPKVQWEFVKAPNYQGEPRFYFSLASKPYYMRLMVTHLPNGIHGVEQKVGGVWKKATMEGDMGQLWLLPDPGNTHFELRLIDADDQLAMGGRVWSMDYPAACGTECTKPGTPADNVVGTGGDVTGLTNFDAMSSGKGIVRIGSRLVFPGVVGDREGSWISARGERRPLPIRQGMSSLPIGVSGVWIATWRDAANATRAEKLFLP